MGRWLTITSGMAGQRFKPIRSQHWVWLTNQKASWCHHQQHVRGPIVLFPVKPLRAIFKWPSSEFVSEIFHCLDLYLIHFNWIVTCRFLAISSKLWTKFWWEKRMNKINIRAGNDVITLMNRWLVLKGLDWDKISFGICWAPGWRTYILSIIYHENRDLTYYVSYSSHGL